jgi:dipeptidase E
VRLYLSSFRIGSCPERLVELSRGGTRAAVVANAMDAAPDDVRRVAVDLELAALSALGLVPDEVDLRGAAGEALVGYDVLWLRGGNTFVLRAALARSGADATIRRLLAEDRVVHAGYSAGICVLAPSLRGLEAVDPPEAVTAAYGDPPRWDGLGVLDHAVVPHVDSPDHPESEACTQVAERYRVDGVPHLALRDGDVLVVDGESRSMCSGGPEPTRRWT